MHLREESQELESAIPGEASGLGLGQPEAVRAGRALQNNKWGYVYAF